MSPLTNLQIIYKTFFGLSILPLTNLNLSRNDSFKDIQNFYNTWDASIYTWFTKYIAHIFILDYKTR